jgi:hypothetical protein
VFMQRLCSSRFGFWGSYRPLERLFAPGGIYAQAYAAALWPSQAITWGSETWEGRRFLLLPTRKDAKSTLEGEKQDPRASRMHQDRRSLPWSILGHLEKEPPWPEPDQGRPLTEGNPCPEAHPPPAGRRRTSQPAAIAHRHRPGERSNP